MAMDSHTLFQILGIAVVACPSLLVLVLGLFALLDLTLAERTISILIRVTVITGLLAAVAILFMMLALDSRHVVIDLGDWISIEQPSFHYHFNVKFVFDRLSVPFVILSFVLCGTISAFADSYMHREPGFGRFFAF
jgi:NADH-quinone oxidoreductase subunit L